MPDYADITARTQAVLNHLTFQQTMNGPVTPAALEQLQHIVGLLQTPDPPPPPPADSPSEEHAEKKHSKKW